MSAALGRTRWAIPGGHVPFGATGREPEFSSFDALFVLNAGDADAHVAVTIFFPGADPAGPYRFVVAARRVRSIRFNDLIDPHAIPLGEDYAAIVESDVPVVVQFSRQDTRQAALAVATTMAFPLE